MRETYLRIFRQQLLPAPAPLPVEPVEPVRELSRSLFFEQDEVRHTINSCRSALEYFERMQYELDSRAVRLGQIVSRLGRDVAAPSAPPRVTFPANAPDATSARDERGDPQPNPFFDRVRERRGRMVRRLGSGDARAAGQALAQIRVERARLLTVATVTDEDLAGGESGSDAEDSGI